MLTAKALYLIIASLLLMLGGFAIQRHGSAPCTIGVAAQEPVEKPIRIGGIGHSFDTHP